MRSFLATCALANEVCLLQQASFLQRFGFGESATGSDAAAGPPGLEKRMDRLENSVGTIAEEVNGMVGKLDQWQHNHFEREVDAEEKLQLGTDKPARPRNPANAEQIAEDAAAAAEDEAAEADGGANTTAEANTTEESGSLAVEAKELEMAKEQVEEAKVVKAEAEKKVAEEVESAKIEKAAAAKAKAEAAAAKEAATTKAEAAEKVIKEAAAAKAEAVRESALNATKGSAANATEAVLKAEAEEQAIEEALAAKADNESSVPFATEADALEGVTTTDAPLNVTDVLADAEDHDAAERHHEHLEA